MNQSVRMSPAPIPFIDVGAQRRRLGNKIDEVVAKVLNHCQFINGPEVTQFESDLAAFCGAKHAVGCASGTDALLLVLMARQIGPGDAVICPAFTFCATAEVVALLGATPVFADVDPVTFNIDARSIERAIATAKRLGLKPKALIPVDLFGLPADYDSVMPIAKAENLFVLDDAAQSFGASYKGRKLGTIAPATATSFFPAKPLGCYGDGGAVLTDDPAMVDLLKAALEQGRAEIDRRLLDRPSSGRVAASATAFLIDWLKTKAPFWKREEFADGSGAWVDAREADDTAAARWGGDQPKP